MPEPNPLGADDTLWPRLLDAGRRVFLREGYARTRMQDVAAEAGLSTGAIYNRCRGKAELFAELLKGKSTDELEEELDKAREVSSDYLAQLETVGFEHLAGILHISALMMVGDDEQA